MKNAMKKRILSTLMILMMFVLIGCGRQNEQYKEAIAILQETSLKLDGSNEVSKELLDALENEKFKKPKNVILMIGDGMGFHIVEAAETVYEDELYNGTLAMNYLPVQSSQVTYSASSDVTDSAAGATALSTGYKTYNGVVAMDMVGMESYETVLELAAKKGKSTGVVATKAVTDATPAAFTAHASARSLQEEIAAMQMENLINGSLDLVLGGGRSFYENEDNTEILAEAKEAGVNYTTEWDKTKTAVLPVIGLYAEEAMDTTDETMPTVAEMTAYALEQLSKDEDGFFLMIEGSQIDTYGHNNNFDREVEEVYQFDCAVAVAMRYVALHPDTVLIVTADHETGGLDIPTDPTKENIGEYVYNTGDHTGKAVPVRAVGYNTEKLLGINENTDIAAFIASLMGEKNFGAESERHTLQKNKVEVTFDENQTEYVVSLEDKTTLVEKIQNVRALHMTVTNPTDAIQQIPDMEVHFLASIYTVEPQIDYIGAGETVTVHYVIPSKCWSDNYLEHISQFVFTVNGAESTLEFSAMQLTERPLSK